MQGAWVPDDSHKHRLHMLQRRTAFSFMPSDLGRTGDRVTEHQWGMKLHCFSLSLKEGLARVGPQESSNDHL